jgi:hypothetical protein
VDARVCVHVCVCVCVRARVSYMCHKLGVVRVTCMGFGGRIDATFFAPSTIRVSRGGAGPQPPAPTYKGNHATGMCVAQARDVHGQRLALLQQQMAQRTKLPAPGGECDEGPLMEQPPYRQREHKRLRRCIMTGRSYLLVAISRAQSRIATIWGCT